MQDEALLRYSRHLLLPQIDYAGQERLLAARIVLIGLGGLGIPAALYLAAAGVGQLSLVDDDTVDLTNLQRQMAYYPSDVGQPKAKLMQARLRQLNPTIEVNAHVQRADENNLAALCADVDVVIDASDNFATRFAVNAACIKSNTLLISGAAVGFEGHMLVLSPGKKDQPCYHCLYAEVDETDKPCSEQGILSPVVGVIGSLLAVEAIKYITQAGQIMQNRLLVYDAYAGEMRQVQIKQDPKCVYCQGK